MLGNQYGVIRQYNASTPYLVTSLSYSNQYLTVNAQSYTRHGMCISGDGTKIWIIDAHFVRIYEYDLSTPFLITSGSYNSVMLGITSYDNQPYGIAVSPDGTQLFVSGKQNDKIYEWSLSTANSLASATYVGASPSLSAFTTSPEGICFNGDGSKIYIGSSNPFGYVYQLISKNVIAATGYQPCISNNIDSTYWTDINSLTATDTVNSGNIFYAISNDSKANWSVLNNSTGVRKIVKNNSGTYQYNSNATYGSETWTNATTNTEVSALRESMAVTANQMTSTTMNAITDANQITLGSALDFAAIIYYASGAGVPDYSGTAINYDANVRNDGAVMGTDYTFDAPAQNKVRITSVNAANLKIRVV
jgi:hypothetical protein